MTRYAGISLIVVYGVADPAGPLFGLGFPRTAGMVAAGAVAAGAVAGSRLRLRPGFDVGALLSEPTLPTATVAPEVYFLMALLSPPSFDDRTVSLLRLPTTAMLASRKPSSTQFDTPIVLFATRRP